MSEIRAHPTMSFAAEDYLRNRPDSCQECGQAIPEGDVFCFDCARAGFR